jgi:hypothetical protein
VVSVAFPYYSVLTDRQKIRLRIYATQEWHDLYQQETVDDLKRFLDFYMKDVPNDWEKTPQVRISVLRYNKVYFLPPLPVFVLFLLFPEDFKAK